MVQGNRIIEETPRLYNQSSFSLQDCEAGDQMNRGNTFCMLLQVFQIPSRLLLHALLAKAKSCLHCDFLIPLFCPFTNSRKDQECLRLRDALHQVESNQESEVFGCWVGLEECMVSQCLFLNVHLYIHRFSILLRY